MIRATALSPALSINYRFVNPWRHICETEVGGGHESGSRLNEGRTTLALYALRRRRPRIKVVNTTEVSTEVRSILDAFAHALEFYRTGSRGTVEFRIRVGNLRTEEAA